MRLISPSCGHFHGEIDDQPVDFRAIFRQTYRGDSGNPLVQSIYPSDPDDEWTSLIYTYLFFLDNPMSIWIFARKVVPRCEIHGIHGSGDFPMVAAIQIWTFHGSHRERNLINDFWQRFSVQSNGSDRRPVHWNRSRTSLMSSEFSAEIFGAMGGCVPNKYSLYSFGGRH